MPETPSMETDRMILAFEWIINGLIRPPGLEQLDQEHGNHPTNVPSAAHHCLTVDGSTVHPSSILDVGSSPSSTVNTDRALIFEAKHPTLIQSMYTNRQLNQTSLLEGIASHRAKPN